MTEEQKQRKREYQKRYYKANREKICAQKKQWRLDNLERLRKRDADRMRRYNASGNKWVMANREHLKEYRRKWQANKRAKAKANQNNVE